MFFAPIASDSTVCLKELFPLRCAAHSTCAKSTRYPADRLRPIVPVLTCIKAVEPAIGQVVAGLMPIRGGLMNDRLRSKILEVLDQHRIMTVATNRPDGWPQATTVGYVHDGLTIYFLCSPPKSESGQPRAR